jgi:Fe2+ or Zn2+ uptake regulation protein
MTTVQEKLGAKPHSYIPQDKQERNRSEHDPEAKRVAILKVVKEREGKVITLTEFADLLSDVFTGKSSTAYIAKYLQKMEQAGMLTSVKAKANKRRFFLGRRSKPENGPVQTVKPAAPVRRSGIEPLKHAFFEMLQSESDKNSNEELGVMVKTGAKYFSHLEKHFKEGEKDNG